MPVEKKDLTSKKSTVTPKNLPKVPAKVPAKKVTRRKVGPKKPVFSKVALERMLTASNEHLNEVTEKLESLTYNAQSDAKKAKGQIQHLKSEISNQRNTIDRAITAVQTILSTHYPQPFYEPHSCSCISGNNELPKAPESPCPEQAFLIHVMDILSSSSGPKPTIFSNAFDGIMDSMRFHR